MKFNICNENVGRNESMLTEKLRALAATGSVSLTETGIFSTFNALYAARGQINTRHIII